ncbi:phosphatase and actin regulator 2 isoform X2 [Amia ocellicauda]|uniref:phosphatase and actin regulator 2 isoform X2 n=1 Tax=Amia ocellicauda TaxID=2972642 RepID=UPI003463CD95
MATGAERSPPVTPIRPLQRVRSQSDTSGFIRKRILDRLITASSVDGLEKASLANPDVVVSGTQTPPLKQKGKLSSLGKIFKPWKWRKKKTSDKFQDLSKVLERKISTRQSREELIRKGVLIPDQDTDETVNSETSNGHTAPISIEPVAEEVQVDIETQVDSVTKNKPLASEDAEDKTERTNNRPVPKVNPSRARELPAKNSQAPSKTPSGATSTGARKEGTAGKKLPKSSSKQPPTPPSKQTSRTNNRVNAKSSHPKKSAGASKPSSQSSPYSSSTLRSKSPKEGAAAKTSGSDTPRADKKAQKRTESQKASTASPPKTASNPGSPHTENKDAAANEELPDLEPTPRSQEKPAQDLTLIPAGPESQTSPEGSPEPSKEALTGQTAICENLSTELPSQYGSGPGDGIPAVQGKDDASGSRSEAADTPSQPVSSSPGETAGESESGMGKSQVFIPETPEVTIIPDNHRDSQASDSDSDGPILYRDEEEEEDEDDEYTSSSLASKIRRRDTLAIKLGNRPSKRELEEKNILPRTSEEERQELWQQIGTKLVRRLSQRPTTEELEQRNILKQKNEEEEHEAKQEIKRRLSRKLSVRPTVAELVARRILRFNEYVEVTDAKDYDRRADKPWTRLTPADKAAIRKELNEFKSKEMAVHEESKQFTRYHRP